jgi:hypothetical protein
MADASIFAQYLKPVKSVAEYQDEGDQRTLSRLKLLLGQQDVQKQQQGFADQNATRAIMRGAKSREEAAKSLYQGGYVTEAAALEDAIAKMAKANADTDKTKADTQTAYTTNVGKALDIHRSYAQSIATPQDAANYLRGLYADPVLGKGAASIRPFEDAMANIPQDPEGLQRWRAGHLGMTPDKFIEITTPKLQTSEYGGYKQPEAVDRFSGKVTATGPQVTVTENEAQRLARERQAADAAAGRAQSASQFERQHQQRIDQFKATQEKTRTQYDADRGGLVNLDTGVFTPSTKDGAPLAAKEKPLTESQAKGSLYLGQMRSASNELENLEAAGDKSSPIGVAAAGSTYTNFATSTAAQKIAQLQNQWAEGFLRAKTGAAATEGEVALNRRTFFPVVGDDPPTIAQKKAMRAQAEKDMEMVAGPGAKTAGAAPTQPKPPKPGAPKPGKTIVRTGTLNGRKVNQYSDGTTDYAD